MTTYKINVSLPVGAHEPDVYDASQQGVAADFVISRDASGTAISRYPDLVWDWSPYSTQRRKVSVKLTLSPWWDDLDLTPVQLAVIEEIRWTMFMLMYRRNGNIVSVATLQQYIQLLRDLGRFAFSAGVSLRNVLASRELFSEFLAQLPEYQFQRVGTVLGILHGIPEQESKIALPFYKEMSRQVYAVTVRYTESLKQTSVIPTRIYSPILSALMEDLEGFEARADKLEQLVRDMLTRKQDGDESARISDLAAQHGLADYFAQNEVPLNCWGVLKELNRLQVVAKYAIHAFSGMRDNEAATLPFDCLTTETYEGRKHFIIKGLTTKFNHGVPKRTQWVTNKEGARAIKVARAIATWIAASSSFVQEQAQAKLPLFVSTFAFGVDAGDKPKGPQRHLAEKRLTTPILSVNQHPVLAVRLRPLIEESDLAELEKIDSTRAWREEPEYQVGAPWPLKTHQMRRSLALYAQRSGLVSLPTLRRQLQHLTEEMSLYYANGSAFAKNFIGDGKDHFGLEWQDTQPLAAGLSYLWNVLLTDEVLFGGHGNWVQQRLKDPRTAVALQDREMTLLRFKKGELAYRETAIGGCTNTKGCDQIGLRWLDADCISGCKNLIVYQGKLDRAIQAQQKLVSALEPNSIDYRMEKADLDALLAGQAKLRATQGEPA